MPNELAPCPFCGASGAELVTYHEPGTVMHPWYRIECDHCGAKGPGTDRGTHREDWNRRAAATAPASRGMSYADRIANRLAQWKNWRPTTDAVAIAAEADAEIAALTATTNEAAAQADGHSLRDALGDIFGIGSAARSDSVILQNAQNAARRASCLGGIEVEFFTSIEEEDGEEVEVCDLPWGADRAEYIDAFRAAIAAQPVQAQGARCFVCGGRGEVGGFVNGAAPGYETQECPNCNGTGDAPAPAVDRGLSVERVEDALADACIEAEIPDSKFQSLAIALRDALAASAPSQADPSYQQRVEPWLLACFGAEIAGDKAERNHRHLEEALELVQACGCTRSEAHQLVNYVFDRPAGDPFQEAGGVLMTLAALCRAQGIDMHAAGEAELTRVWGKVEQIRAKQAAKPKHSPLPQAPSQAGSCQASGGRLDADWIVREVAELPDRNSPTDWPDAMLVTADELRSIILAAPPAGRTLTEIPAEIIAIAERLHTQDNRITDNPLFAVQQKRRVYGLDEGYEDAHGWSHPDRDNLVLEGDPEFAELKAAWESGDEPKGDWSRVGFKDTWEFVTGCLTEQGCKDFIRVNGHNLHEPRIYAYGSYRNAEFIALRKWLMSLAASSTTAGERG